MKAWSVTARVEKTPLPPPAQAMGPPSSAGPDLHSNGPGISKALEMGDRKTGG